jgi:D-inositol-3-phosphate glycosyltransferase
VQSIGRTLTSSSIRALRALINYSSILISLAEQNLVCHRGDHLTDAFRAACQKDVTPTSNRGGTVKIAIFVSHLPPHVGGIEAAAESQIKALATAGHDVAVITSASGSKPGRSKSSGYEMRRIRACDYLERRIGAVFPIYSPTLIWHAYKVVKNAHIVHVHDGFYLTSLVAAVWARALRKPLIVTQHVSLVPHPGKLVNLAQRVVYASAGCFIWRSSEAIVVLNSRVKEFLIDRGIEESKIMFLPNGIDVNKFSPACPEEKQTLRRKYNLPKDRLLGLFVGRLVPKKGFTELLQLKSIENLELVFAGGYAPNGHARNDHHFLGCVSREHIQEVFKMCDIFLLPSQGEGFPVTVQEAMACGLPVITTADPAYDPYKLDKSLLKLVEPPIRRFHAALQIAANDPALRLEMGRYSRAYAVENFDLGTHVSQLLSIYSQRRSNTAWPSGHLPKGVGVWGADPRPAVPSPRSSADMPTPRTRRIRMPSRP